MLHNLLLYCSHHILRRYMEMRVCMHQELGKAYCEHIQWVSLVHHRY